MAQHIGIIQISHPGPTDESQGDTYWRGGVGSHLRSMYGELLGMVAIHIGYHKLVHEDGHPFCLGIGLEGWPGYSRPDQMSVTPSVSRPVQLKLAVDDLAASLEAYRQAFGLTYEVARCTRTATPPHSHSVIGEGQLLPALAA